MGWTASVFRLENDSDVRWTSLLAILALPAWMWVAEWSLTTVGPADAEGWQYGTLMGGAWVLWTLIYCIPSSNPTFPKPLC